MRQSLSQPSVSWTERLTDIYILLMLTVFPLYTGFEGYAALTEAKLQCFLVLTVGYFGLMILLPLELLLIGKAKTIKRRTLREVVTPTRVLVAGFVAVCTLSALVSPNRALTWMGSGRYEGLMTTLLYAGVFLLLSLFARPKLWHAYVAAGTLTVVCTISVTQYLGLNPFWLYPQGVTYHDAFQQYSGAFLGTIGNIDLLSTFLCLGIPLLLAGFLLLNKWQLLPPAALGVVVLLLSGVSGGLVGLGLGALLLAPWLLNSPKRLGNGVFLLAALTLAGGLAILLRRQMGDGGSIGTFALLAFASAVLAALGILLRKKAPHLAWTKKQCSLCVGMLVLAVLVGGLALVYFWPGPRAGTLYEASQLLHGEVSEHFGSGRVGIWKNCLELVPEHSFLGGGPGTLELRLQMAFQREVQPGLVLSAVVDTAHNEYLDLLVNVGILGLGTYLAALVSSWISWRRRAAESRAALMLAAAIACYLIQAVFSFSLCITAPFFWMAWGLLDAKIQQKMGKEECKT